MSGTPPPAPPPPGKLCVPELPGELLPPGTLNCVLLGNDCEPELRLTELLLAGEAELPALGVATSNCCRHVELLLVLCELELLLTELDGVEELEELEEVEGRLEELEELDGVEELEELDGVEELEELDGVEELEELDGVEELEELDGVEELEELDGVESSKSSSCRSDCRT